jgi:integrase
MLAERPRDVPGTKACCARFLLFAESAGATGAESLGPAVTASYVASLASEPSRRTTYWRLGHVRALLGRLVSAGAVPESTTWFASTVVVKGAGMCVALPGAAAPTSGDGVASANDAARLSLRLVREVLPQLGYAYGTVKTYENVLLPFCASLLVNGLDYDPAVGAAWVEANREASGAKWRDHRRALLLLEHMRTSGGIPGDRVPLVARADPMCACPEWARGELVRYLDLRRREGCAEPTVANARWACVRLVEHVGRYGVASYADLTPEMVEGFSLDGAFSTPGSRALAVSRVRGFLERLEELGLARRGISLSAASCRAPQTRVLKVLDGAQVEAIRRARKDAATPIELRDAAMVSLGLWAGLRTSDVVGLRLDAISWRESSITVVQRKTLDQLTVPLAPEAGNSVIAWLRSGRPASASPLVFVSVVAPFGGLAGTVCDLAIRRVLGDTYGDCTGFHELRRSYATGMLRGGCGQHLVSDALGHRSAMSARPYLALDDERMRRCAMPLELAGVPCPKGLW